MHIKKGDNVIVITGADKGKKGKVLKAFPALGRVIVEGVNVHKKHQRPRRTNQKGQVLDKAFPIQASNVLIADPGNGAASRIGKKLMGDKYIRVSKKSGSALE